jgi:pimeloyl-ACP methyl ester carboxylesterase
MSTLLLSGWTQAPDALAHVVDDPILFDYSDYASADLAIDALKKMPHTQCVGWSMGGQLLLRAIAEHAIAPKHLTLIASPLQFVSDDAHLKGMDTRTFELFRASYASDAPRTAARFKALLAKGDRDAKRILPLLGAHHEVHNTQRFLPWLDDLGRMSLVAANLDHAPPTLIIHGTHDAIVPHAQGEALFKKLPRAQLNSWAEVSHVPHVHDGARIRTEIMAHRAQYGDV